MKENNFKLKEVIENFNEIQVSFLDSIVEKRNLEVKNSEKTVIEGGPELQMTLDSSQRLKLAAKFISNYEYASCLDHKIGEMTESEILKINIRDFVLSWLNSRAGGSEVPEHEIYAEIENHDEIFEKTAAFVGIANSCYRPKS